MRASSPPRRAWRAIERGLASMVTALATSRPPGRRALQQASNSASLRDVAAEEDRVGRGLAGEACRAPRRSRCRGSGTPSLAALTAIICSRSPSRSKAMARASRAARIHSMRDRAAAGADVPEQRTGIGRELGERRGANLALGELAVGDESVVGQAGDRRQQRRAGDRRRSRWRGRRSRRWRPGRSSRPARR